MKIGVMGCTGRMGKVLLSEVLSRPHCLLSGGTVRAGSKHSGEDLGQLAGFSPIGLAAGDNLEVLFQQADAVIDFTSPETSLEAAALAAKYKKIHVIGTTGFTEQHHAQLAEYAKSTVILWSSNMSIAVTILATLVEQVAGWLEDDYDIEILEMHHRHKKDAPSGTAITLGEAAARGRKAEFNQVKRFVREGITGERPKGEIGFATLRGGGVIGDHTVIFASEEDRLELTHKSASRSIYAKGAVRACLWARNKAPGLYSIKDVLYA